MARVFQYVRPVNAVLTSIDLENKANCSENEIRIKEEPPDLQYDDPESLLNDVDAGVENESVSPKHHHSSVANNENNQYMLRSKFADSNKNSLNSAKGRSKRPLGVASESRDSQQSKRRRANSEGHSSSQTYNAERSAENKVVCNICFTAFKSVQILKLHLKRFERSLTCMTCDICNDVFSSTKSFHRHKQKHYQNSAPDHRYRSRCSFCQRKFSSLKYLQMHLFHYHTSLMQLHNFNVEDIEEIEERLRAANFETKRASKHVDEHESNTQTEETDNRVIQDPNVTQGSVSTNESVSEKDPECILIADIIDETERDTSATNVEQSAASSDVATKSDGSGSVKKKMRQTTLTEFLSFSGKSLKKGMIKSEKVNTTEGNSDMDGQDTKNWTPGCASTPVHTPRSNTSVKDTAVNTPTDNAQFLTMHMNPESIITLLNNQIKTEPVDHYSTAESQKSLNSLKTTKHPCPALQNVTPSNASVTDKRTLRARLSQEERLRIKYKCRECVVRLIRCDYTSNRVLLKIDESNSIIPLQLRVGRPERKSIDSKGIISKNPQIRIMKLENCIVVEVLGSR